MIAVPIYWCYTLSSLKLRIGGVWPLRSATKRMGSSHFPVSCFQKHKTLHPAVALLQVRSSSQLSIAKTYTVQTNGHSTASKAKKPSHGSHSVSVNCNEMSANYSDTFAYFRITNNTFGARLNPPEQANDTIE